MSDKHKAHKKDAATGHDKPEDGQKAKDKPTKTVGKDEDMPGAAGFISARADEDTYD
jgi:hypothetical protein